MAFKGQQHGANLVLFFIHGVLLGFICSESFIDGNNLFHARQLYLMIKLSRMLNFAWWKYDMERYAVTPCIDYL